MLKVIKGGNLERLNEMCHSRLKIEKKNCQILLRIKENMKG